MAFFCQYTSFKSFIAKVTLDIESVWYVSYAYQIWNFYLGFNIYEVFTSIKKLVMRPKECPKEGIWF